MTLSEFDLNYGLVCVGNGVNFYIMQTYTNINEKYYSSVM